MNNNPCSLEAEQAVLGAILISPEVYEEVAETLSANDFYSDEHRQIYDSMTALYLKNTSLDLITLLEDIVSKNAHYDNTARNKTKEYLMCLSDNVPVIGNIKEYIKIIKEKSMRRKLIDVSSEIVKMAKEDTANTDIIIDKAEQMIFSLAQIIMPQNNSHVKNILIDVLDDLKDTETRGLSTGFSSIDNVIGGMNGGELIVIGARPSMGKTAFAMNMAINVVSKNKTVQIFSLELSKRFLVSRLLSSEAFVDIFKFKTKNLNNEDWEKIIGAEERISECDLYIDDTPNITITGMKTKIRQLKKLDLIIIDDLQLIQSDREPENRNQEIAEISRNLKIMAKEFDVPIIVCATLSRGPEYRDDKRPMLVDLRDSGAIEQDADIVMFIYRDDYYKNNVDNPNHAEIIFAKNKHGAIGKVEVGFEKRFTRFYDIEE